MTSRRQWLKSPLALLGGAVLASRERLTWAAEEPAPAAPRPATPATSEIPASTAPACRGWPAWAAFKAQFLSDGGRVVDGGHERRHTVSEAQAYALFFALVADDRPAFAQILHWTEHNLADGDLTARLPAWQWGRRDDGSWGVLDANPASDADLWIAYALGEAGRLWQERRYVALSSLIAARVLREETVDIPDLGRVLLPGPKGFAPAPGLWRLNPSYAPPQQLAWFAARSRDPAWHSIAASGLRLVRESAPKGYAPEWALYRQGEGFVADSDGPEKTLGSYNAIRVYLWAGMLAPDAAGRSELLQALAPMGTLVANSGTPPEQIDTASGIASGSAASGFSAALLPFLQALGAHGALEAQQLRLEARPLRPDAYYEQVLGLFALGWMEQRYAFAADGSLLLPNTTGLPPCA